MRIAILLAAILFGTASVSGQMYPQIFFNRPTIMYGWTPVYTPYYYPRYYRYAPAYRWAPGTRCYDCQDLEDMMYHLEGQFSDLQMEHDQLMLDLDY